MSDKAAHLAWLVLLVGTAAYGADAPETAVIPVKQPPVIDGRLDDACWQGPPQISGFRLLVEKGAKLAAPTQRTEAWLAADEDALYVAARCYDERMDMIKASETGHDTRVWRDDCIELFLMAGDTPPYYHLIANLAGGQYDARQGEAAGPYKGKPASWNGDWAAAAQRSTDCWTMEFAVPFACLDLGADRIAQGIRFNIGREQRRLMEISCWPASGFHEYKEYALLKGVRLDPKRYGLVLRDVSFGERVPGKNRFRATVAEEPTPNAPLTLRARVRTLPNGEVRTATAQALSAPKAALEMDYRIPFGGGLLGIAVDVLDSQGKARAIRLDILRVPDAIDASLQLPLLYRTDEAVRLAGRLAIPAASLEKATFEVALCVGGKPTAPGAVQIGAGGAFHAALPVSSLAPGRYAVEARLVVPDLSDQPIVQRFPFQLLGGPAE